MYLLTKAQPVSWDPPIVPPWPFPLSHVFVTKRFTIITELAVGADPPTVRRPRDKVGLVRRFSYDSPGQRHYDTIANIDRTHAATCTSYRMHKKRYLVLTHFFAVEMLSHELIFLKSGPWSQKRLQKAARWKKTKQYRAPQYQHVRERC